MRRISIASFLRAVHGEIGKAAYKKFASAWLAARSSLLGKLRQRSWALMDGEGDAAGNCATAMLFEIVRNLNEVASCGFRPTNPH
jgi:hypothetical protein